MTSNGCKALPTSSNSSHRPTDSIPSSIPTTPSIYTPATYPSDSESLNWQDISIGKGFHSSNGHTYGESESIPHTKEKNLPGGGNWVVQKFGGTSVGKFAEGIAEIVRNGLVNNRIAVVCSARSSYTKTEGTTNRLLRAAKAAESAKGSKQFNDIVQQIQDDHINAAKTTIVTPELLESYIEQVEAECQSLIKVLESAQHLEEVSKNAENKIISKGEKLSCRYMAVLLQSKGIPAQFVDLSDVVKQYDIPDLETPGAYQKLAQAFGQEILACGDQVPVVTGYFGNVPDGLLHSIGRGYTDLAAALVAIGTSARELQIWKEVDGIFSADPRKVPTAKLLPTVTPSEAAELTFYGSEVIHPFTMEQVIKARIPIRIKNVMNPRGTGTVILPDPESTLDPLHPKISRGRSSSTLSTLHRPKRPTAVTIKHSIVVLNIHSNRRTRAHGFLSNIFQILDRHNLAVDLISSSEVHVSMALHSEYSMLSGGIENDSDLKIQDIRLHGAVEELAKLGNIQSHILNRGRINKVDIVSDMAIVSLVGKQLKNMTGISGKMFSVLGENGVNIEMISQGMSQPTSHLT